MWALCPIRQLVASPKMLLPLLQHWVSLAGLVITGVHMLIAR